MAVSGSASAAAQPLPLDGDLPERWFGLLTMTDIVRYQGASGDLNPMHHDDELARGAGYPQAFGVGMLGAGYLATWATDQFGTHTVRRFRTRFQKLMWRGDRLRAGGRKSASPRWTAKNVANST